LLFENPSVPKVSGRLLEFAVLNDRPDLYYGIPKAEAQAMKYGYFANIHDPTQSRDYGAMIGEMRELARFCDEAGFETFWLPEHHFSVWGRELLGNPLMMAADLAARTERIRLGLAAAIITFWHPLRLAEDLALLDHLTEGRLDIGVGRGNYGLEASNLNPAADPNNRAANVKVFLETLEVVRKALTEERFAHSGELFTFPAPGFRADKAHTVKDSRYIDSATGELVRLTTYPRPKQRPVPPLWQVVSEDYESIRFCARNDLGIIMWRPTTKETRRRLQVYKETWEAQSGRTMPLGRRAALVRDTFVAESANDARRIAGKAVMDALNFANWRGARIFLDPEEHLTPDDEARLGKELTFEFVSDRALLFGSPDEVLAKLIALHEETGIEQVIFKSCWPGLPHEHTMRSMQLLTGEILPRFEHHLAQLGDARVAAE
jgi:alkanesulfonate monooxygenase SsuD/methylene tetrahydromethanopterin reductase-like flavin-dependent oxidoreductase (luciferase family)